MRKIEVSGERIPADPGPPPMLQWIEIERLVVDESYQRDLLPGNWKAIRAIAENFRWSRFSPVFCAPVEGGLFAIIDGQHRTHAAAMCGCREVPCQVVQMSRHEQAEAFSAVNGAVTAVTIWNLFRAELVSGDPQAVALAEMAKRVGCQIATSNVSAKTKRPGTIYFIQGIRKLYAQHGEVLERALKIVRQVYPWTEDPAVWGGSILMPVLEGLCGRPDALSSPRIMDVLADFDIYAESDKLADLRRKQLRSGLPVTTQKELLRHCLVDYLDRRLPGKAVAA